MNGTFPQVVFGYHGCRRSIGEAVLSGKLSELAPSTNSYDWLGHGVYFWENAPERAREWASQYKEPFVLGAIINLGNCLNLADTANIELLRHAYKRCAEAFKRSGLPLPVNNGKSHRLDCLVINAAVEASKSELKQNFDTIRSAFPEDDPIYPGSALLERTHVQICVRNPQCICGYFRPGEFVAS